MADEQTTTVAPGNSTEARTTDGTLKDQSTTTTTESSDTAKTEQQGSEGTTLLTEGDKTKTEGEKTEGDKKDEVKGAPEKYEPFKAPEGHEYTKESIAEAEGLFRELGLNQAQAQKLMDTYAAKALAAQGASAAAYKTMREGWQAEVKADPEIGKILPAVKVTIGRALDSLGDPALATSFKAGMDLTGAGDHPAFVKTFYKLAQAVVESGHVAGTGPSPLGQSANGKAAPKSAAQAMYPNLPTAS